MEIMNTKMARIINETNFESGKLNKKLSNLLIGGFVKINDCFLLKSLYKNQTHITKDDFIDNTGFECFINSFHTDDYIDEDFLSQGHFFINELFKKWKVYNSTLTLKAILTQTDFGSNIKFHVIRPREYWINENNLENYEEPIIILSS